MIQFKQSLEAVKESISRHFASPFLPVMTLALVMALDTGNNLTVRYMIAQCQAAKECGMGQYLTKQLEQTMLGSSWFTMATGWAMVVGLYCAGAILRRNDQEKEMKVKREIDLGLV